MILHDDAVAFGVLRGDPEPFAELLVERLARGRLK
jgi:hypothetical protein